MIAGSAIEDVFTDVFASEGVVWIAFACRRSPDHSSQFDCDKRMYQGEDR